MADKPKIHGYTTLLTGESTKLPYLEALLSWSQLCDTLTVCLSNFPKTNKDGIEFKAPEGAVSPWEDDGTKEVLEEFNKTMLDGKLHIVEHEWDYENPLEDGITKQIARTKAHDLAGTDQDAWLAQFDCDEILREEDVPKLLSIIIEDNEKDIFGRRPFIITGILEFFGGTDRVRFNFGNWLKIRLTRNLRELVHGLPIRIANMAVRGRNENTGKLISIDNRDDGAGFISSLSLLRPDYNRGLFAMGIETINAIISLRREPHNSPAWTQVPYMLEADVHQGVWIYHTSWVDIKRKWAMGWFFDNFWSVLSGKQDTFIDKVDNNGNFTRTNADKSDEDLEKELTRPEIKLINNVHIPKVFDKVKEWRYNIGRENNIPGIKYEK